MTRRRPVLLGRLKDEMDGAGEIARLGQVARGPEQHGRVAVMAAGMHLAGVARGVGEAVRLLIGSASISARSAIARPPEPVAQRADDAGPGQAAMHLDAELGELRRDDGGGALLLERHLGIGVDVVAPPDHLLVEIGDAIDDRHRKPPRWSAPTLGERPETILEEVDLEPTRARRPSRGVYWRTPALDGVELFHAAFTGHRFARHWHPGFALGVVVAGVERFYCRGAQNLALPRRTIIAVSPGEIHDGEAASDGFWAYRMAYPTEATVAAVAAELAGRIVTPLLRAPALDDAALAEAFVAIHRRLESGEATRLTADTAFLLWLGQLLRRHADLAAAAPPPLAARDRRIGRVLAYIDANLGVDLTLDQLAAIAGIGRFHLLRSFVKALGITPHAFLAQRRVLHGKLLLDRGVSAAEAALDAGFFDQSHFANRFRRAYGMTPRQYQLGARAAG